MNLIFAATALTLPHPPSVWTAITSVAQLPARPWCCLSCTAIQMQRRRRMMRPKIVNGPPMTGFAVVFNIFMNGCVCHVGFHQYMINSTQNVGFFHACILCFTMNFMSFLHHKVRRRWWALHLSLGSPSCRAYGLSKSSHLSPRVPSKRHCWYMCGMCCFRAWAVHFFPLEKGEKSYMEQTLWRWTSQR